MARQDRLAWYVMAVACVLWGAPISAQVSRVQSKVVSWETPDVTRLDCFGILGEITHPGVYTTASREVTLQELVQQAGGTTPQASGTIRIVRQARTAQSLFFSPTGHDALQPQDVVVIDSAANGRAAGSVVWLCLIGVSDRPAIVPVRPELAQLTTVVGSMLHQSEELAQRVRIVLPPRSAPLAKPDSLLPSSAVLIFDPSLLVTKNLPSFPDVIGFEGTPSAPPISRAPTLNVAAPQLVSSGVTGWSTGLASQSRERVDATPVPFPSVNDDIIPANPASLPAPGSRFYVAPPPPTASADTALDEPPLDPRIAADESVVGSSRVDLQACKLEYSIVSPK